MEPRVYHMNQFVRVFYCFIGLCLIGPSVFILLQLGTESAPVALLLCLPGIYCFRWAIHSRLTLTETEISVRYAFGEQRATISEIEGWRKKAGSRSGPFWVLKLKGSPRAISIDQKFAVDDTFRDFLAGLRNLNDLEISVVP